MIFNTKELKSDLTIMRELLQIAGYVYSVKNIEILLKMVNDRDFSLYYRQHLYNITREIHERGDLNLGIYNQLNIIMKSANKYFKRFNLLSRLRLVFLISS